MTTSSPNPTAGSVRINSELILRGLRTSVARISATDDSDKAAKMGIIRVTNLWNELEAGVAGTTTPPVADQPAENVPANQEEEYDDGFSDNSEVRHPSHVDVRRMLDCALKRYGESILIRCIDEVIEERITALLKDANHLVTNSIHRPVYSAVEKKSVSQQYIYAQQMRL